MELSALGVTAQGGESGGGSEYTTASARVNPYHAPSTIARSLGALRMCSGLLPSSQSTDLPSTEILSHRESVLNGGRRRARNGVELTIVIPPYLSGLLPSTVHDSHAHPTTSTPQQNILDELARVRVGSLCAMSTHEGDQELVKALAEGGHGRVTPCFGAYPSAQEVCCDEEVNLMHLLGCHRPSPLEHALHLPPPRTALPDRPLLGHLLPIRLNPAARPTGSPARHH